MTSKITVIGEISPGAGNSITMCITVGGSIRPIKCCAIGLENGKFEPTKVDSVLHLCDGIGGDWVEDAQRWCIKPLLKGKEGGSQVQFWTKGGSTEQEEVASFNVPNLHIETLGKSPCQWVKES